MSSLVDFNELNLIDHSRMSSLHFFISNICNLGHDLRKFTNIFVGGFTDNDAYGLQCGLMIDDIVIAVNGKEVLGQDLTLFQDIVLQSKKSDEPLRFSVYRDSKSAKPLVRREEPAADGGGAAGAGGDGGDGFEDEDVEHPSAMLRITEPLSATHTVECPISPNGFQTMFCGGDLIENPAPGSRSYVNVFVEGFKEGVDSPHGYACGLREGDVLLRVNGTNVLGEDFDVFYDALKAVIARNETAVLDIYREGSVADDSNSVAMTPQTDVPASGAPKVNAQADTMSGDGADGYDEDEGGEHPSADPTARVVPNTIVRCTVPASGGFKTLFAGGDAPESPPAPGSNALPFEHVFVEGFVDSDADGSVAFGKHIGLREADVICAVNGRNTLGEDFDVFHAALSGVMRQGAGAPVEFSLFRASAQSLPPSSDRHPATATADAGVQPHTGQEGRGPPPPPPRMGASAISSHEAETANADTSTASTDETPSLPTARLDAGAGLNVNSDTDSDSLVVRCPPNEAGGGLGVMFAGGEFQNRSGAFDPIQVEDFSSDKSYGKACGLEVGDVVVGVGTTNMRGASLESFQDAVMDLLERRQVIEFFLLRDKDPSAGSVSEPNVGAPPTAGPSLRDSGGRPQPAPPPTREEQFLRPPPGVMETPTHRETGGSTQAEPTAAPSYASVAETAQPGGALEDTSNGPSNPNVASTDEEDDHREGEGDGWEVPGTDDEDAAAAKEVLGQDRRDNWDSGDGDDVDSDGFGSPRQSAVDMMNMDTQRWLQSLNLGQFIPAFSDAGIYTIEDIGSSLDRLKEIGLNNIQQRRLKHMLGQYSNEVYMNLENVALMNSGVLKSQKKWRALISPKNSDGSAGQTGSAPQTPLAKRSSEWPTNTEGIATNEEINHSDNSITKPAAPASRQENKRPQASVDLLSPHRRPQEVQKPEPSAGAATSPSYLTRGTSSTDLFGRPVDPNRQRQQQQDSATSYPYGLHHPNLPRSNPGMGSSFQLSGPSSTRITGGAPAGAPQRRPMTVSALSPYVRAEQYQAMYQQLTQAKERLAAAKNVHVLLRAVRFERMVADNNVDAAILQETLLNTRLRVAAKRKETEELEKTYAVMAAMALFRPLFCVTTSPSFVIAICVGLCLPFVSRGCRLVSAGISYEKTSKNGTGELEDYEHQAIVLSTKTDEARRVVRSDPAERIRYRLEQDKSEYLEAATSAMQHFIERERKNYQRRVQKLTTKFSPPAVMASLQKNTRAHRFWTRSVRDSLEAETQSVKARRQVLNNLQSINASVRYDDPARRLVRYTQAVWMIRRQFMNEAWTGSLVFFQSIVPFLNDPRALEIVQKVLPLLEKRWINALANKQAEQKMKSGDSGRRNLANSPHAATPRRQHPSPGRRHSAGKASTYAASAGLDVDEKRSPGVGEASMSALTPSPGRRVGFPFDSFLYSARGSRGGSESPSGHSPLNRGLGTPRETGRRYTPTGQASGQKGPSPGIPVRRSPPHPANWKHYSK